MDEQVKGIYPVKMLVDENGQAFVPLSSWDAVEGSKDLQYIFKVTEKSSGHFKIEHEKMLEKALIGAVVIVQWPTISSTVKPSYLQFNDSDEKPLYNGNGTEYLDLEESSNTINMFAYDGNKWILTSGAGSGSGHVITDDEGHTMEQQKILNFVGFNVENDTANRATKIINPTPINNLTTSQSGQGSLDAYQGYVLSTKMVPTGGQKGQVLAKSGNEDHQLEWINKDSDDVVTSDGSIEKIIAITYEEYKTLEAAGELAPTTQYHITDFNEESMSFISEEEIQNMIDGSVGDFMTESDVGDFIKEVFTYREYNTANIDTDATGSWTPVHNVLTTDVMPAGIYLIGINTQYTGSSGAVTQRLYIDGGSPQYYRFSTPCIDNHEFNASALIPVNFTENKSHTLEIRTYAPTGTGWATSSTRNTIYRIIKLG